VATGGQPQVNVFAGRKNLKELHPNITTWLAEFRASLPAQGDCRASYDVLMGEVVAIKVVLNADLFVTRGIITAGFHGETRIIRHLFLKYLCKTDQDDLLSPAFSRERIAQLEKKFKEFFAKQLHFGPARALATTVRLYGHARDLLLYNQAEYDQGTRQHLDASDYDDNN
jgi:hypothetical protein